MPKPPLQGATATTAASGGNREELLGQRPAGCERQRSRRWEPQPGLVERSETERLYEGKPGREALQRRFTQVSGNTAAPRGAGYFAKFRFFSDSSFEIEHRKLCEVGLSCEVGTSQMTRTSQTLRSSNIIRIYIKYSEHRKMFHHSRTA